VGLGLLGHPTGSSPHPPPAAAARRPPLWRVRTRAARPLLGPVYRSRPVQHSDVAVTWHLELEPPGSAGCGSADAAARAAGQIMEVAAVCCQSRVAVIQEQGMGGMAPAAALASEEEGAAEDSGERAALAVLRALSGF